MLPPDDAALDALIGETVARCDGVEFTYLVMAAFSAARLVQARHLARGTILLPETWTLGAFASHMQGDIATPLVDAARNTNLNTAMVATALALAAEWHKHHSGGKLPGPLIGAARAAVRDKRNSKTDWVLLHYVALLSGDAGIYTVIREAHDIKADDPSLPGRDEAARKIAEHTFNIWRRDPLSLLPAEPKLELTQGTTMRRAVQRVGRNEPCPCGSGRKYKHCCLEKDHERLQHSTAIAGVTAAELRANPEAYLTSVRLEDYPDHEVARFDPLKVPPDLRLHYLAKLCRAKLYDAAVEAMEKIGYNEAINDAWKNIMLRAGRDGRKDLVERMLKMNPEGVEKAGSGDLMLMMADQDPAAVGKLIMDSSFSLVTDCDLDQIKLFAHSLLDSKLCALGILVARGLIPILPQQEAARLLDDILRARDILCLSPDEPFSDILDKRFLDQRPDEGKDAEALREAQRRLVAKVEELGRYKESVERLQKELTRREELADAPAPTPAVPVAPVDGKALEELRQKMESLKSALKERHNERNELRRELQKAHTDLEELRQKAAPAAPAGNGRDTDHEEDLLLPQEAPETQPVRVIEFPKHFQESLASLPKSVARGTLTMLGRLAAGEPAAFVGAVRLKACPSIMRHRIGIDFRLLFRILPDRVQVVDLIPRQDLERKIKTLV